MITLGHCLEFTVEMEGIQLIFNEKMITHIKLTYKSLVIFSNACILSLGLK